MRFMQYGEDQSRTVVLLHGGGLSWWNYRQAAMLLQDSYRVILPILDGHADADAPFSSIEENARRIICFIDESCGGQVCALGGVSLGGQIALEILSQRPDICRFALIESALVRKMPLTRALTGPAVRMSYGLIRRKWFARLQAVYLGIPKDLFEDYYRDTCGITKDSMIAFMESNSAYATKAGLSDTRAKALICVGGKELPVMRRSARQLDRLIRDSRLLVLRGYGHGALSLNHPRQYADLLQELTDGAL